MGSLPSGKRLHNYRKSQFSIAMLVITRGYLHHVLWGPQLKAAVCCKSAKVPLNPRYRASPEAGLVIWARKKSPHRIVENDATRWCPQESYVGLSLEKL